MYIKYAFHYTDVRIACNSADYPILEGKYAHPYFALGWKAMEAGWYTLAHHLLDQAIDIDSEFHMAYVGKMLSNDNMGYGFPSYKQRLRTILNSPDFEVKLSLQEQLIVKAFDKLQSADNFKDGLRKMSGEIRSYEGSKDKITDVIAGNAELLSDNAHESLLHLAETENNVYALQLLTHNLNPYTNGKTFGLNEEASTKAVYAYQSLRVYGAWQISADCSDIALYYSEWGVGNSLLSGQRTFLFENTDGANPLALLREEENNLIVQGLEVKYMSKALARVNEYEILHFFQLQV